MLLTWPLYDHTPPELIGQRIGDAEIIYTNKTPISKETIFAHPARGPLINENDLREALLSGKVQAATVDVLSCEPAKMDNPLMGLPNCLITPHIAWANKESRQRLMDIAVDNLRNFLGGTHVNNVAK